MNANEYCQYEANYLMDKHIAMTNALSEIRNGDFTTNEKATGSIFTAGKYVAGKSGWYIKKITKDYKGESGDEPLYYLVTKDKMSHNISDIEFIELIEFIVGLLPEERMF